MATIDELALTEEGLDVEFEAQNGETLTLRTYLDRAIKALDLEPGNYPAAFEALKKIASQAD